MSHRRGEGDERGRRMVPCFFCRVRSPGAVANPSLRPCRFRIAVAKRIPPMPKADAERRDKGLGMEARAQGTRDAVHDRNDL